jgi:hypothetical protein
VETVETTLWKLKTALDGFYSENVKINKYEWDCKKYNFYTIVKINWPHWLFEKKNFQLLI